MAASFGVDFSGIAQAFGHFSDLQALFLQEFAKALRQLMLKEVRKLTPVVSGRLKRSYRLQVKRQRITAGVTRRSSAASYARFVQFKQPVEGADTVRQLLQSQYDKIVAQAMSIALQNALSKAGIR